MGNTVVLKPAEFTSASAICFAEICQTVGLPPGVVNIVTGDGDPGAYLAAHPDVDKIAFTGSTEVGRLIRAATAGTGTHLSLELGGKSPFLVFEDADLDSAVEGVVDAIFFNQGEVCCAGSRLLVQEGIEQPFYEKLRRRMQTLRVGDPLDKGIDVGAVVAPVQIERIEALVQTAVAEGATRYQPQITPPPEGCFYLPTLLTGVEPASPVAQQEIFGPVLVAMSFRTPADAVALANDTRYGLAASVWTENIDLALDVATRIKAGTVWVNSTNQFDAAAGFGGYRESGFGREGGREGLWEYVKPPASAAAPATPAAGHAPVGSSEEPATKATGLDRTAKMYIGGKQTRPDGGYTRVVEDAGGARIGDVGEGSAKDIRNAVSAARKASGWATASAHLRAQVLYYIAENLEARADELAARIHKMTACGEQSANDEVAASIERLFIWAAWADKYDGRVHSTAKRQFTFALKESIGTIGVVCPDERPLLAFISTTMAALSMGNTVIAVPSARYPLAATDLYQVLDTSDLPGGVLNIVTGSRRLLGEALAAHDDVDALWHFGSGDEAAEAERLSCGNLKRTWCTAGRPYDWNDATESATRAVLRQAVQVKNVWVPYGA